MASKPILFNTEMVKAILDGRKTQTRRVMKHQPTITQRKNFLYKPYCDMDDNALVLATAGVLGEHKIPPYEAGDILWVRETFTKIDLPDGQTIYGYKTETCWDDKLTKWRPSIHMPREAARIFLRVINVRVERLQEITVESVIAEGLPADNEIKNPDPATHESITNWNLAYAQYLFRNLWNITIKKQDLNTYGWEANPWVWIYEFERVSEDGSKI